MCTNRHSTTTQKTWNFCYDSNLKTGPSCLPLYPQRFILAPNAMQKIKGNETKKYTHPHNTTSPLYVQFMRAQQETHNKTCRRKQKMREIHGQVHFLIACHTARHQGVSVVHSRPAVSKGGTKTARHCVIGKTEVFTGTRANSCSEKRRIYVRIRTTFRRFHVDWRRVR